MMAMTPEAKVKRRVTDQLKQLGAYYFYPMTGGYGRGGLSRFVLGRLSLVLCLSLASGSHEVRDFVPVHSLKKPSLTYFAACPCRAQNNAVDIEQVPNRCEYCIGKCGIEYVFSYPSSMRVLHCCVAWSRQALVFLRF